MAIEKKSKSLAKATKMLLSGGETEYVDFKRTPDGVHADDLVSFANSDHGGEILVGIAEEAGEEGSQRGVVIGCDISDGTVLQILNKAISCIPPIAIKLYAENTTTKPILRVYIPPSENKPHSTPKGVYCRRDGSRNRPLHPGELLRIFLDNEGRAFAQRFEEAAGMITNELADLQAALDKRIASIGDQLGWAEFKLDDSEGTIDTILAYVKQVSDEANDTASRLRALFRQDKRDDPVRSEARKKLLDQAIEQLSKDSELVKKINAGGSVSLTAEGKAALELNKSDLREIFNEAVSAVSPRSEPDKSAPSYRIEVKSPSDCSDSELKQFVALVNEGGEVANGLDGRVRRAVVLAMMYCSDDLVGTAAIKRPNNNYRKKVFQNANAGQQPSSYPVELGWIYIAPEHRGKGKTTALVEAALHQLDGGYAFATTRQNNEAMHHVLQKTGFSHVGNPYASKEHHGEKILLFLRPAGK